MRKRVQGRYTVSGPYEKDHPVPNVGAGCSCAQTFASRHRDVSDELTYYVRELSGILCAMVTKGRERDHSHNGRDMRPLATRLGRWALWVLFVAAVCLNSIK